MHYGVFQRMNGKSGQQAWVGSQDDEEEVINIVRRMAIPEDDRAAMVALKLGLKQFNKFINTCKYIWSRKQSTANMQDNDKHFQKQGIRHKQAQAVQAQAHNKHKHTSTNETITATIKQITGL